MGGSAGNDSHAIDYRAMWHSLCLFNTYSLRKKMVLSFLTAEREEEYERNYTVPER